MRSVVWVLACALGWLGWGCGDDVASVTCGEGTTLVEGSCVAEESPNDDPNNAPNNDPMPECATNDTNEPNDAPEQASDLSAAQVEFVGVCAGDEDWFAVEVPSQNTLLAIMEVIAIGAGDPLGDVQLDALDGAGVVLAQAVVSQEALELTYVAEESAEIFVRVHNPNKGGAGFIYDLDSVVVAP